MRVWKFPFFVTDLFTLEMPRGAKVLYVDVQYDAPCMWALVDTAAPKEPRHFRVVGTGHPIEDAHNLTHVASFQMASGQLVWHLFEQGVK